DGVPVIGYVHTPARWIWEAEGRRGEVGGAAGRAVLTAYAATQRRADRAAAARTAGLIANSRTVEDRIRSWWHRPATAVPPPGAPRRCPARRGAAAGVFFRCGGRAPPAEGPRAARARGGRGGGGGGGGGRRPAAGRGGTGGGRGGRAGGGGQGGGAPRLVPP